MKSPSICDISRSALCTCLLAGPLYAETIAHWDMSPTGNTGLLPATLDLATGPGQGTKTGNQGLPAPEDHLISLNGNGDTFATSSSVPPNSMFRPGSGGGSASYDASSLAAVDGALLFPQDFHGDEFSLDTWTVELFFRSNGNQSGGGSQQILLQNEASLAWGLVLNENSPGGVRLTTFNGATFTPLDLSDRNYADGQWYYAVASYNSATKVMKLRIRGEDGQVSFAEQALVLGPHQGAAGNLFIGRNTFGLGADPRTFMGLIDEVRISDTIVPDNQLMGNLAGTPATGDSTVIARWSMELNGDGSTNPRVLDSRTAPGEGTRTGNSGAPAAEDHLWMFGDLATFPHQQVVPPAAMMAPGKDAGATSFDPSFFAYPTMQSGALFFPQDAYGPEFAFTGSFTAEMFFKTVDPDTGLPADESGSGLMQLLLNSENDMKFALVLNENAPGGIRFAINDSVGTIPVCDISGRNYADGQWHYIKATYDATPGRKGVMTLVVRNEDGSFDVSSVDVGASFPDFTRLSPAFSNLFVGRNQFGADAPDIRNFSGLIDEVQITKGVVGAPDELGNLSGLEAVASSVAVYSMPGDSGTVTGSGIFESGTTVDISATPRPGYVFAGWSGDFAGQSAAFTTAPLTANQTATANFAPDTSDSDGDGLTNFDEVVVHGTNPLAVDSDNDGLSDFVEVTAGSNPLSDDSALVSYLGSASGGVGSSITRDPDTGRFTLKLDLTESLELDDWYDLPVAPGDVSVSGGDIMVELPEPPAPAAFWRFSAGQGAP